MTPSNILATSVAILCLGGGMASAQSSTTPFENPAATAPDASTPFAGSNKGMGDHIASRVLNMNGYNITNVGDPFFEGDAVTLGYFQRNMGWDHKVKRDLDMGGFAIGNIREIALNDGKVLGGIFDAPAISQAEITGGTLSGVLLRSSSIEVPMVTGGTFKSPALLGPTLDQASMTGGDIDNADITSANISDSKFKDGLIESASISGMTRIEGEVDISEATMSGNLNLGDNRISSVSDATEDGDAMNLRMTRSLIEDQVSELSIVLDGLRASIDNGTPMPAAASEVTSSAPVKMDISEITEKLKSVSGDFTVYGSLNVSGVLNGVTSQFRPTPSSEDALGRLTGSDAMDSLREIRSVVYNLPEGGLAIGIDPATIPPQLEFVKRSSENDKTFDSVDYDQMIGPMMAAIQYLDRRVQELENRPYKLENRP